MKFNSFSFLFSASLFAIVMSFSACHEHDDELTGTGSLEIEFDHLAGGQTLELGKSYTNAAGEAMSFSEFKYYVSNFSLVKSDGSVFTVPKDDCYFLISEKADGKNGTVKIDNIPAGDYKEFRFIIGVDSLKSVSPAAERTGVLDPAGEGAGMYWAWNSGYIFVKVEGESPAAPLDSVAGTRRFRYHIGLFGGFSAPTLNNIKSVSLSDAHGDVAKVRNSDHHAPHLHLYVDVLEMFTGPNNISVATNPTVMASPFSKNLADNYQDMFVLDHIHN
jgi:hypothetical protein